MLYTILMPFLLIPMVGLAMDSTKIFIVREKLQGSVDGAAIAAAQSMNTGSTNIQWQATAQAVATQFMQAAFPTGYFSTSGLTASATVPVPDPNSRLRTVTIIGKVQVALAFPTLLGFGKFPVSAAGQASRRDVVLVMVIDRSGSMSELSSVQSAAKLFVADFTPGRDKLGLVLMGGSSIIAYPPADWDVDPMTGTLAGPDANFTSDSGSHPAITTQLANMTSGSNTGTAEALWFAYRELLAADETGALNVIVLFTDGMPNGITAVFNGPNPGGDVTNSGNCNNGTSVRVNQGTNTTCPTPPSAAFANGGGASTCANKINGSTAPIMGWMALEGGYKVNTGPTQGVYQRAQLMSTYTLATLVANPKDDMTRVTANAGNCYFTTSGDQFAWEDFVIPDFDYYGDSLAGASQGKTSTGGIGKYTTIDYQQSEIYNSSTACNGTNYNAYAAYSTTTAQGSGDSCQLGLASWNAADMAAMWIRLKGTTAQLAPAIYTMGYAGNNGNNNADDPTLMLRLSNVSSYTDTSTTPATKYTNSVFDGTYASGMYIRMTSPTDIGPAFQAVAAQIVRLSM
jgi:hypothetical protein